MFQSKNQGPAWGLAADVSITSHRFFKLSKSMRSKKVPRAMKPRPTAVAILILALAGMMVWPTGARAVNWLTYHYDNARDGANTNEVVLTPANVNTNHFFKLFTY